MENRKISVVVVDDSAFMRMVLKDIIDSQQDMEVVGFARDGIEALEIIPKKKPDVVTLDVEMPKLNGIEVLKRLMKSFPTRVIMVSSLTEEGADITLRALTLGAVDFITKPAGSTSMSFRQVADLLIEKIREAAIVDLSKLRKSPQMLPSLVLKRRHLVSTSKVVVIGS
ncbi:MAG: chemotaxis response regulator protein-glutamate methylesterase, partial [Thermotogae bacterium]